MRFSQGRSGGEGFVVEIANIIKTKQTPKGLDLSDRAKTVELLGEWCTKKCEELKIDPGSECMIAMHQITHKMNEHHGESMAGHETTHQKQDQMEAQLKDIEKKISEAYRSFYGRPKRLLRELKTPGRLVGRVLRYFTLFKRRA